MLIKSVFSAGTEKSSFLPESRFRFTISRLKKEPIAALLSNAEYYGYVRPLAVTDWSVGVFSRTVDRKAVLVQLFIRNVFVWLATFLTAIVIGFLASISVVRAVEKLTRQMTAARILPDKSERIKSPRELVQLQRTYGRMQERLITAQTA